jgi:predicted nuclease with TOPRIM domain
MKKTNLIEENQKLKDDNEYFKQKFKEAKKENRMLREENEELKKNLENF